MNSLENLLGCYDNCAWNANCAVDECSLAEATCFFERTGQYTCSEVLDCNASCADNDNACVVACIEKATRTGQAAYLRLNPCVYYFCPPGQICEACYSAASACGF